MFRVVVAAAAIAMIACGSADAAAHRYNRHIGERHDSWRSKDHHSSHGRRGESSYGGDLWRGSSYETPKKSGHRRGL